MVLAAAATCVPSNPTSTSISMVILCSLSWGKVTLNTPAQSRFSYSGFSLLSQRGASLVLRSCIHTIFSVGGSNLKTHDNSDPNQTRQKFHDSIWNHNPIELGSIGLYFHDLYDITGLKHSKERAILFIDFFSVFFHNEVCIGVSRLSFVTTVSGVGTGKKGGWWALSKD